MIPKVINYLVVEDLVSDSVLLQRQLKKISEHPEIRFVDSILSLKAAVKTYIPDFVITDFNLVEFNAFDVLNTIKDYNANIPVLVITGNLKNDKDKNKLINAGADGFFYKDPISNLHERLIPVIKELIIQKKTYLESAERQRKKKSIDQENIDFLREFGGITSSKDCYVTSLIRLFRK